MVDRLLTPRDWQAEAIVRAAKLTGTPEGDIALVEAKRYAALADRIDRLRALAAGATRGIPVDAITVNLVRNAGLPKDKARECEVIVLQVLGALIGDAPTFTQVKLGPEAFRFDSFQHWVNKAQSWFQTRMPERARAMRRYLALDAAGRICLIGSDFHRARDEGKFPVVVYLIDEPEPAQGGDRA